MKDIKIEDIIDDGYSVKCVVCGKPATYIDSVFGVAFCSEECRLRYYELYGDIIEQSDELMEIEGDEL